MYLRFLLRAFVPHAVWLVAVAAVTSLRLQDHWQAWAGILLGGLVAWFVTDLLVTGRVDGDRIFKPIRTGRPAGEPQWVPEYWSWIIALFPCAIVAALFSIAVTTGRPQLFAVGAAVDAVVVILALFLTDGHGAFCRNVRPVLEHAVAEARQQAKTQAALSARAAAKAEALRYYEQHRDVLADTLPPALFLTRLEAAIPQHAAAKDAYEASRDLIGELQPKVAEGRERQRREAELRRRGRGGGAPGPGPDRRAAGPAESTTGPNRPGLSGRGPGVGEGDRPAERRAAAPHRHHR